MRVARERCLRGHSSAVCRSAQPLCGVLEHLIGVNPELYDLRSIGSRRRAVILSFHLHRGMMVRDEKRSVNE